MDTVKINGIKKKAKTTLKKNYLLVLIIISLLTGSCAKSNVVTTPSHEVISTFPVATVIAIPIIPALSFDEAQSKFQSLLVNNGGCKLPCFWGINPGKTLFQEAVSILAPLSSISEFTRFEKEIGAIDPDYIDDEFNIHTSVRFLANPNTNTVSQIGFTARAYNRIDDNLIYVFDSSDFIERFSYYMLTNILTEYGKPTKVMMSTMAKLPTGGASNGGFNILLLYPEQGMLVNYTMPMQVVGENIMGCPSNSHVKFDLYPSGQADLFFDRLEPTGWNQIIQNTYKPIDEATTMSKDDFYQTFIQQTDKCILTPASLWPIPD
ncbi:MAG: hypothetical protein HZB18_05000 [Chloroflexi bacterium]|nr:hypothetical protein [Chloroflexota bacterium]